MMDVASESSTKVYDGSNCSEDAFHFENLLQNWTLDTFQFIINSSQSQTSMLFSTYSWEIFDKLALATQPFSPFMRDGLPLVYKAILDSAAGASAASSFTSAETLTDSHDSRRSAITGIALGFCEGLAGRSKVNYYDESAPSLSEQVALCSERISHRRSSSSYKYNEIGMGANEDVDQDETCRSHYLVGFLSHLCAEIIIHIKDPQQRMSAVHSSGTSSDSRIGSTGTPLDCIKITKSHRACVLKYLNSAIPVSKESQIQKEGEISGSERSYDAEKEKKLSLGSIFMEDIVSWGMVSDDSLRAAVGDDTEEEDEMDGKSRFEVDTINLINKKKSMWMKNSGLNVATFLPFTEDQSNRQGQSSREKTESERKGGIRWSLLGIAMIGEIVLGSLTSEITNLSLSSSSSSSHFLSTTAEKYEGFEGGSSIGIRSMIPRVYSTDHLWKSFYPLLFPLFSSPQLAAGEGLRLISHLVSIIQGTPQSRVPVQTMLCRHSYRTAVPTRHSARLFFLPPSILQILSSQLDPAENEGKSTDDVEACPYTLISVRCLRKVISTLSNRITGSNIERNSDRDMLILAGVGVARSSDALTLIQGLVSTLASSPDDNLRKTGLSSLKVFLSLFEPWSLICLLKELVADCPFPHMAGLLIDIVKDHCQSQSASYQLIAASSTLETSSSFANTVDSGMRGHELKVGHYPFLTSLVVTWFCLPSLERITTYSVQTLLDSAGQIGAAINLLRYICMRMKGISIECSSGSKSALYSINIFMCEEIDCWNTLHSHSNVSMPFPSVAASAAAVNRYFHDELQQPVSLATKAVKEKVRKVQNIMSAANNSHTRRPWVPREDRGEAAGVEVKVESEINTVQSISHGAERNEPGVRTGVGSDCTEIVGKRSKMELSSSDLLQLEIIWDNLEHLTRLLSQDWMQ